MIDVETDNYIEQYANQDKAAFGALIIASIVDKKINSYSLLSKRWEAGVLLQSSPDHLSAGRLSVQQVSVGDG